jgi:hypothetical protein
MQHNNSFESNMSDNEQQDSIKKLQGVIKSDLYHCPICNSKYSNLNKPKVLYCGDCFCEVCLSKTVIDNYKIVCLICA